MDERVVECGVYVAYSEDELVLLDSGAIVYELFLFFFLYLFLLVLGCVLVFLLGLGCLFVLALVREITIANIKLRLKIIK